MNDFDWISKAFIGILGTTLSVVMENFSLLLSLCAAVLTIIYMYMQITIARVKKKDLVGQYTHNKEARAHDRKQREYEREQRFND